MRRQRTPVLWGGIFLGMVFALALGAQETPRSDDAPGGATASESDGPDAGEGQGTSWRWSVSVGTLMQVPRKSA